MPSIIFLCPRGRFAEDWVKGPIQWTRSLPRSGELVSFKLIDFFTAEEVDGDEGPRLRGRVLGVAHPGFASPIEHIIIIDDGPAAAPDRDIWLQDRGFQAVTGHDLAELLGATEDDLALIAALVID